MTNHADDVVETEVRAPTVSEAIQQGLMELGATRDEVKIEVLNEGSRGILGIFGAEDARVRLRLRRPRVRQPEPEPERPAPIEEKPTPVPEVPAETEPVAPMVDLAEPEPETEAVAPVVPELDVSQIAIEAVQTLVQKIGVPATVELRQRGEGTPNTPVLIDIKGKNLGVLIGPQGATLRALQYITRLIISRQTHTWSNVIIDVDGYRQRREDSLVELAQRVADRVRKNGRPISLEPMLPHERRIIHLTLQNDPDVTTRSVGQGDQRKVVVRPRR